MKDRISALSFLQKVKIYFRWLGIHLAGAFLSGYFILIFIYDKNRPRGNREATKKYLEEYPYPPWVNRIKTLTGEEGNKQEQQEIGWLLAKLNQTTGFLLGGVLSLAVTILSLIAEFFHILIRDWKKEVGRKRQLNQRFDSIDSLSGYEFELFVKSLFEEKGYRVKETKKTGDQGADLIVSKEGVRSAVQVKRYTGSIGNHAVQEVVGSLNYYQCTRGVVVTSSYFTPSAIELAKVNNITLIDRDKLQKFPFIP